MWTTSDRLRTVISDGQAWNNQEALQAYLTAFEVATHFALKYPAEANELALLMEHVNPGNPGVLKQLVEGLHTGPRDGEG